MSDPYAGRPGFVRGSDTSEAAADSVADRRVSHQQKVLKYFKRVGTQGTTDDDIEVALGLRHQTASARRRELELKGLVSKTDRRRRTRSGRTAAVYVINETEGGSAI